MAKLTALPYFAITVNATQTVLNAYIESAVLTLAQEAVKTTASADNNWEAFITGLKSAPLEIDLQNDFASGASHACIKALFDNGGTGGTFELRPNIGSVSATNPKFTGTVLCVSYTPISGKTGGLMMLNPKVQVSGAVTYATS